MIPIVLALAAAVAYGTSDFLGGRASTQAHFSAVTSVAAAAAVVVALIAAPVVGGTLSPSPLVWGVLSGVGSGMGTLFLYRGLARARIAVVAPTSGVLAASLPAAVAIGLGERPAPVVIVGLIVALPAVWLIAGGGEEVADRAHPSGLWDGVLAGFGFGLLFFALDRAGDSAGLWPLAAGQVVAFILVSAIAISLRRSARPGRVDLSAGPTWALLAILTGVLGSTATLLFYASTTTGLLTIAAVLTSLYPAATIVLARLVLDERLTRRQGFGLALAGLAVVLITIG